MTKLSPTLLNFHFICVSEPIYSIPVPTVPDASVSPYLWTLAGQNLNDGRDFSMMYTETLTDKIIITTCRGYESNMVLLGVVSFIYLKSSKCVTNNFWLYACCQSKIRLHPSFTIQYVFQTGLQIILVKGRITVRLLNAPPISACLGQNMFLLLRHISHISEAVQLQSF